MPLSISSQAPAHSQRRGSQKFNRCGLSSIKMQRAEGGTTGGGEALRFKGTGSAPRQTKRRAHLPLVSRVSLLGVHRGRDLSWPSLPRWARCRIPRSGREGGKVAPLPAFPFLSSPRLVPAHVRRSHAAPLLSGTWLRHANPALPGRIWASSAGRNYRNRPPGACPRRLGEQLESGAWPQPSSLPWPGG